LKVNQLITIIIILIALIIPGYSGHAQVRSETIAILHTNDEGGVRENLDIIASYKNELKDKYDSVFLLSSGGALSGSNMIQSMNQTGYDALNIGVAELAAGQEALQKNIGEARFPVLSASLDATGSYLHQPEPYILLDTAEGHIIAILGLIGLTEEGIPPVDTGLLGRLDFTSPVQAAANYSYLAEIADIYIGLTYLGHGTDRDLARVRDEFDFIIGGQSKTVIKSPPVINNALITQAGSETDYLGKIIIEIDSNGQLSSREASLIDIKGISENK